MNRFVKPLLAAALLSMSMSSVSFAATNASSTMSPAEKAQIEEVVHQYLLKKPEVLVEAMQILQRQQYEKAEQTMKQTQQNISKFAARLFRQSDDPIGGNANGKFTIVEFFDYQCPHCVDMAPVLADIIKANPDVRVVFKEFPIRGPMSELAARAALAANKQGKYVEFNHALFMNNKPLSQDVILEVAKTAGLDVDKLKKDMNDSAIDTQLKNNVALAQELKLFGTPAFFIGKTDATTSSDIKYVPGQMNQTQLQTTINDLNK